MRLDIVGLFLIGCFVYLSDAAADDKDVYIKIQLFHNKPDELIDDGAESKDKDRIIIHNHGDSHYYEPDYADGNYKQLVKALGNPNLIKIKPDYEKEYVSGYSENFPDKYVSSKDKQRKSENNNYYRPDYFQDDFTTSKSVTHFEIKELNPTASSPEEQYIVRGGFKLQETDPYESTKKTKVHTYDSPLSKIAAAIYSHYDYLNFPHGSSHNADLSGNSKQRKGQSNDEDIDEFYGKEFPVLDKEEGYEEKKKPPRFNAFPEDDKVEGAGKDYSYGIKDGSYESEKKESRNHDVYPDYEKAITLGDKDYSNNDKYHNDADPKKSYDFNPKKQKSNNGYPYENKQDNYKQHDGGKLDYFSSPSSVYAKDWQKYVIQQLYGEVYAPSNTIVQKVPVKRKA